MEETISLTEIFEVIKKRFLLILAFVFGAALIAAVVSYFVLTPTYQASSQFIVNQGQQDPEIQYNANDLRTNVELINTYNVIITSAAILEDVVQTLDLDVTAGALAKNIKVSSEQSSQVVTVTATDTSPITATEIANTTVKIFQDKIPDIMNVDNVSVLTEANVAANPAPVAPNPKLNIAIAIVLGGMVGVGLAFLLEYLDKTIRTEDDIEKHLGLPVLGIIPHIDDKDISQGHTKFQTKQVGRGGYDGQTQKESI